MPWDDQSTIYHEMKRRSLEGVAIQVVDTRDNLDFAEATRANAQKTYNEFALRAKERGITNSEIAKLSGVTPAAIDSIIKAAKKARDDKKV